MRKFVSVLMTAIAVIGIAGCGSGTDTSDLDMSSVEIKKDGTITSIVIDDFSEDYYNVDELKEMAEDEINTFNMSNGEGSAELVSVSQKDDKVKMVTSFSNTESYAHFNYETLMYIPYGELSEAGQALTGTFVDKDGNTVSSDELNSLTQEHVVITSNKTVVAAPYKIKYVSSGASLIDSYMVDLSETDTDSTVYIVLNK